MGKKILVIDDALDLIELTKRLLQSRGYETSSLTDGDQALEFIKKDPPDLIIMDMLLPGKDGTQICHEIKSDPSLRHIPVILSTGQVINDDDLAAEGLLKPDDYLTKPFEIDDLLNKINHLLSTRS